MTKPNINDFDNKKLYEIALADWERSLTAEVRSEALGTPFIPDVVGFKDFLSDIKDAEKKSKLEGIDLTAYHYKDEAVSYILYAAKCNRVEALEQELAALKARVYRTIGEQEALMMEVLLCPEGETVQATAASLCGSYLIMRK